MIRHAHFLLLFLFCIVSSTNAQVLMDYIVAVVNDEAITRSELDTELRIPVITRTHLTETWTTSERRAALETIIDRKLVLQESERLGIVITKRDARVAEKIAEIRKTYPSDVAFQRALQKHGLENEALEAWVYNRLIYDEFFRRIFFNALNSAEVATLARAYYDANLSEFVEHLPGQPARQKTYAEVSEEIIARIQQEKAETEFAAWLVKQRQEKSWHIFDDALAQESKTK